MKERNDIEPIFQELADSDQSCRSGSALGRWLDDHWVWIWLSPIVLLAAAGIGAIAFKALGV